MMVKLVWRSFRPHTDRSLYTGGMIFFFKVELCVSLKQCDKKLSGDKLREYWDGNRKRNVCVPFHENYDDQRKETVLLPIWNYI